MTPFAIYFRPTVWRGPWQLFGQAEMLEIAHRQIENILDTVATRGEACIFSASSSDHSIGHTQARKLRPLAECEQEHGAINRLVEFRGNNRDIELCAAMYERADEGANAAELRRLLRDNWPERFTDGNEPGRLVYQITALYRRTIEGLRRGVGRLV